MKSIDLYDTTLRDGTQMTGVSPSVEDKLKVLKALDRFGVAYVEGGWPGSNPKDAQFFARAQEVPLQTTVLTAFGMTRRAGVPCDGDANLAALVESGAQVACVVGKASVVHVRDILHTSLEENLAMVAESVEWLRAQGMRVFFDAEHFFDGFIADAAYAIEVLQAAANSGAEIVVLCDTNGGNLPDAVAGVVAEVVDRMDVPVGGHFHNDSGCGVANSLASVTAGAVQIQGCINGYGERCGNADLIAVAANLELKMGITTLPAGRMALSTETARYVAEVFNMPMNQQMPFTGDAAFAHKGGIHVSAVLKEFSSYEHTKPEAVGNDRRFPTSDLSGLATLRLRARSFGLDLDDEQIGAALARLKRLEHEGHVFEAAEGSLQLLLLEAGGWKQEFFEPVGFRAISESDGQRTTAEATVRLLVGGQRVIAAAEGDGPVHALDRALRNALRESYPEVDGFHLTDYKVRVLDPESATAAKVRVLAETSDGVSNWSTVGVSSNIIEASCQALIDAIAVGLVRYGVKAPSQTKDSAAV